MCDHGDTVPVPVVIPAHLSATGQARLAVKPADRCIAPIVEALNAGGVLTAGSCCGHGRAAGEIPLQDGRWLIVAGPGLRWWQRLGWALMVLRVRRRAPRRAPAPDPPTGPS